MTPDRSGIKPTLADLEKHGRPLNLTMVTLEELQRFIPQVEESGDKLFIFAIPKWGPYGRMMKLNPDQSWKNATLTFQQDNNPMVSIKTHPHVKPNFSFKSVVKHGSRSPKTLYAILQIDWVESQSIRLIFYLQDLQEV